MSQRIRLCESLSYKEMFAHYSDYDLFVVPSSDEPAGIVILEAMANGVPVCASDSNSCKCYLGSKQTSGIFASDSLASLIDVIRNLVDGKPLPLKELGKQNYEIAAQRHSAKGYVTQIEGMQRELERRRQ
jgi:glycosyltransferase involved in cell wall biosynthesis